MERLLGDGLRSTQMRDEALGTRGHAPEGGARPVGVAVGWTAPHGLTRPRHLVFPLQATLSGLLARQHQGQQRGRARVRTPHLSPARWACGPDASPQPTPWGCAGLRGDLLTPGSGDTDRARLAVGPCSSLTRRRGFDGPPAQRRQEARARPRGPCRSPCPRPRSAPLPASSWRSSVPQHHAQL